MKMVQRLFTKWMGFSKKKAVKLRHHQEWMKNIEIHSSQDHYPVVNIEKKPQVYIWLFFFHDQINIALVISNSKLQNIQCFNRRNHFSSRYQVVTKTLETLLLTQLSQHAVWLNKSKGTKNKVYYDFFVLSSKCS